MKNTRRKFFRSAAALGLLIAMTPSRLFAREEFPSVEGGVSLRKVYRNGKQIRMSNLKNGDRFELEEEGRRWSCVAESDPFKTDVGDGRKTWTVVGRTLE